METIKRKTEEEMIRKIKAKFPKLGEDGDILDYEAKYELGPQTKTTSKKENKENLAFSSDKTEWELYSEAYYQEKAEYPEDEQNVIEIESASSAYAVKPKAAGSNSTTKAANAVQKPKSIVAEYPSSEEDE